MKAPRAIQILAAAAALSPVASAWPAWPRWLPAIDALVVRADTTTAAAQQTTTTTTGSSASGSATPTGSATTTGSQAQTTNLNTGGVVTATGNTTASATHTEYDPQSPAGGVAMLTPATTASTQLYKIGGTPITWVWNYTSLLGTPTAVDVMVSCSAASETWTLTQNMTFAPTGTYTWDTKSFQSSNIADPLLTEEYTLIIIDADSSVTATAEAGYLAPFTGFQFGMYSPQPYQNLSEWLCATCSAGRGDLDRQAFGFMLSMCFVTVLTFTWLVTGF